MERLAPVSHGTRRSLYASGTRAGRFAVLHEIGEGGTGAVYDAVDPETGQRAAVKVLVSEGRGNRERFEAEARLLAAFDHPAVPTLLGSGAMADGRPYLAMEHVGGAPITEFARAHALGTGARLALFADVCEAVRHVHARLVVHCDVKPPNVLASRCADGKSRVHLVDFGAARRLAGEPHGDGWVGEGAPSPITPAYAAPEQFPDLDGRTVPATTAADVFALGSLLYELLTGLRPLDGGAPPSRVAELGVDRRLSRALDAVVERAIDPVPTRRYASSSDLLADVQRVRQGQPPTGARLPTWARAAWAVRATTTPRSRRRPWSSAPRVLRRRGDGSGRFRSGHEAQAENEGTGWRGPARSGASRGDGADAGARPPAPWRRRRSPCPPPPS